MSALLARKLPALRSLSPPASAATASELAALVQHVRASRRLVVLTGAGISTHSGIPDYRSPHGSYSRGHKPIQHMEFVRSAAARQRYWARSFVGWQFFSRAEPNEAHHALRRLETAGRVSGGLVTQNVDGLHSAAGHPGVIDLHGRIDAVECLNCGAASTRAELQTRLHAANEEWAASRAPLLPGELRADGDSELSEAESARFVVPSCTACGGVLKPDVTFFGGSVPPERTRAAAEAVEAADALLVVGTSLQVFSAFRLARSAAAAAAPIAILTNGPTRADELLTPGRDLRVTCDAAEVLPAVAEAVLAAEGAPR